MSVKPSDENAKLLLNSSPARYKLHRQSVVRGVVGGLCASSLILADAIAFLIAIAGAAALTHASLPWLHAARPAAGITLDLMQAGIKFLPIAIIFVIYCLLSGHYRKNVRFWSTARQIILVSLLAILGLRFGRADASGSSLDQTILAALFLLPATVMGMRWVAKAALVRAGIWNDRVLIVGTPDGTEIIRQKLQRPSALGFEIAGSILPDALLTLAQIGQLHDWLLQRNVSRVIVVAGQDPQTNAQIIRVIVRERVPFALTQQYDDLPLASCDHGSFSATGSVMFCYQHDATQPWARMVKVGFDIVAATILLLVLSIPMLAIALLIRLDGGPALFAHERVGAGGRTFRCLKFRSMVMDSAKVLQELLANDLVARVEWAQAQKLTNDPRITRIGRFLRATSLDELPQLINVLRLEMSLVGPRPIVSHEVPRYAEDISFYYETKPGVTGLWQVSGRSNTTYERRVELDASYVKNWSIWHDFAILLKTIPAVLLRHGAK